MRSIACHVAVMLALCATASAAQSTHWVPQSPADVLSGVSRPQPSAAPAPAPLPPPAPAPAPSPGPCQPRQFWIPGHYEWRDVQVWVPGYWHEEYVPPVYQWRIIDGQEVLVMVQEGWVQRYYVPGHYEIVAQSIWIPGHWEYFW